MKKFDELISEVERYPKRRVLGAVGQDPTVISAVVKAHETNLADAVLVGHELLIKEAAKSVGVSIDGIRIIHESDPIHAVATAVKLVSSGEADILMKGYIHTDDLLRGVVNKEYGLRTGAIMSRVFVVEIEEQGKLIFISDCAMNILPDLEQKAAIILNAVYLSSVFGVKKPMVVVLAAVELVNPKMQATVDAACLAKMSERKQYSPP